MSTVEIASDVAGASAHDLAHRSRRYAATADALGREFTRLGVTHEPSAASAVRELLAVARYLDSVGRRLDALVRAAESSDRFPTCTGTSPPGGDIGETFTCVERSPWRIAAHPNPGLGLVARALADTADETTIGRDEFEIVRIAADRYVLVLAGVTDLGHPDLGYDEHSQTVRDVDQGAFASAIGPTLSDNEYGRYVRDAALRYIPRGSRVAIVGHSYGADTALDLAADPVFNGQRYDVTHVAAFGYDVTHHIAAVPAATEVVAVNNSADVIVLSESLADGPHLVADGHARLARAVATADPGGAMTATSEIVTGLAETVRDVAALPTIPAGLSGRAPTVSSDGQHHTITFSGGIGRDVGHGQDRYVEFVNSDANSDANDRLTAFGHSLVEHGYVPINSSASSIAVDVSLADDPTTTRP